MDEKTWFEENYYPALIRKHWQEAGKETPTVVTLSFGPAWIFTEHKRSPVNVDFDFFQNTVLPLLRSRIRVSDKFLLLGESMGGYNSVQLSFHFPELFSKVASLCPSIAELSPYATSAEIDNYLKKNTSAAPEDVSDLLRLGKVVYSEQDWLRETPLQLVEKIDLNSLPPLYINAGFSDRFGTFSGTELFSKKLLARGANLSWHPQWGGHCATDIKSVADFLLP